MSTQKAFEPLINSNISIFNEGRILGRDEERRRTQQLFNELLSSKIIVASFAVDEISEKLAADREEESGTTMKATMLLRGSIDAIIKGCEEVFDPDIRESSASGIHLSGPVTGQEPVRQ